MASQSTYQGTFIDELGNVHPRQNSALTGSDTVGSHGGGVSGYPQQNVGQQQGVQRNQGNLGEGIEQRTNPEMGTQAGPQGITSTNGIYPTGGNAYGQQSQYDSRFQQGEQPRRFSQQSQGIQSGGFHQRRDSQRSALTETYGVRPEFDPSRTRICVTGANSFLGGHIVAQLLHKGYLVRGTVKDPTDVTRTQQLTSLPGAVERLELVKGDLLQQGSFDSAVRGCQFVIHTACPFVLDSADPQTELLEPARDGTLNVLRACSKAPGLRRVVLTSAFAAISEPKEGHTYTERDWNRKATLKHNPFHYAKVEAERAAWSHIRARGSYQESPRRQNRGGSEDEHVGNIDRGLFDTESMPAVDISQISDNDVDQWDLIVINPAMMIGPSFNNRMSHSLEMIKHIVTGKFHGIADVTLPFVDVRDVATAHLRAIETRHAHGRYIICNPQLRRMRQLIAFVKNELNLKGKGYKFPRMRMDGVMGNLFIKYMVAPTQRHASKSFVKSHTGHTLSLSTAKAELELGMTWTDWDQTIRDTIADMVRWRHLQQPTKAIRGHAASDMYWGRPPLREPLAPDRLFEPGGQVQSPRTYAQSAAKLRGRSQNAPTWDEFGTTQQRALRGPEEQPTDNRTVPTIAQ